MKEEKILTNIWKIMYFCFIAIPIGTSNSIFDKYLTIVNSITIFDLILICLFIVCNIKRIIYNIKKGVRKIDIILYIYFILLVVYIFIGYKNVGMSSINDSISYIRCYFMFEIANSEIIKRNINIYSIINITINAIIVYSILSITYVIFYYKNFNNIRIGSNHDTIYIFVLGYLAYKLLYESKKINFKDVLIVVLFLICSTLSKSRIFISFSILSFILVLVKCNYSNIEKKFTFSKKTFFTVFFTLNLICFAIFIFLLSDNSITQRFIGTSGESSTGLARINTFLYYFEQFKINIWGYGFGYIMHFVTSSNYVLSLYETYQIDNAIIVYAIKCGIIFLILNVYIIIKVIKKIDKIYKDSNDRIFYVLKIGFILLLISGTVFTSQLIQGRAVSTFIWSVSGYIINFKSKNEKNKLVHSI